MKENIPLPSSTTGSGTTRGIAKAGLSSFFSSFFFFFLSCPFLFFGTGVAAGEGEDDDDDDDDDEDGDEDDDDGGDDDEDDEDDDDDDDDDDDGDCGDDGGEDEEDDEDEDDGGDDADPYSTCGCAFVRRSLQTSSVSCIYQCYNLYKVQLRSEVRVTYRSIWAQCLHTGLHAHTVSIGCV
jgi:hypothetical protein